MEINDHPVVPRDPLISICVLNYNYGQFVGQALDSALAQTYERVEVIVVDDGSTDDSSRVIGRYGDRVRALRKENGGQASSINAAFSAARGDVVMFLDADDILCPEIAGAVAKAFERQPETAKVQFRLVLADASGNSLGIHVPPRPGILPSGDLREHVVRYRNYAWQPTSANAHPTWVLRELLPMPEKDYRGNCDTYLAELVPLLGPVCSLDDIGLRYRLHGANDFAGRRVDPERLRIKLEQLTSNHSRFHALATRLGIEGVSRDPTAALDPAFITFRLASLKLDPARHPLPTDRAPMLVVRGIKAVLRHPHLSVRDRFRRTLWFLAVGPAPRPLARRLIDFYLPDGPFRPRWDRARTSLGRSVQGVGGQHST